jgi:hypothetical protein
VKAPRLYDLVRVQPMLKVDASAESHVVPDYPAPPRALASQNRSFSRGVLVSVVAAHPHCRVLFLQTIKHLFGQNARAAHKSSSNRVFQFRHHPGLSFFLLFQENLP